MKYKSLMKKIQYIVLIILNSNGRNI